MKLYKFRSLAGKHQLERIQKIIKNGFYCCDFLSFNDMNEGVFSVNAKNFKIELSEKQKYKICSFSGENALDSQLMWGHYANAGMGVVIEVEVEDCAFIKQVKYINSIKGLNTIEDILTRKSKEWKYEDEFRYINNNLSGSEVKIGKITNIYFGTPYEKLINYDDIKEHPRLKEYLKLKGKLKVLCEGKNIKCRNYEFKFS